jgi:hypothetical protein
MSRRLPWVLAAVGVLLVLAGIGLSIAAGSSPDLGNVLRIAGTAVFGVLGALIATRHPRNPIGWIFCAVGVFSGLGTLALGYTELWLEKGTGPDRLGETAAVYHNASWIPNVLLPTTFLLLLFPDGRVIGPRWRLIGWCAAVGMVGGFAETVLHPGRVEDFPQVQNPYGSDAADPLGLAYVVLAVGVVGSAVSLVIRFRRAASEQRQQIKWLALAGAVAVATLAVMIPLYEAAEGVANVSILFTVMLVPVAAGVAILRYHLYDIDVVINRTLVYATLTATLAGAYLASVLLLQLALSPLTEESDLAIAASTLAVAALFRPARSRIQAAVDRRFFRSKYDAQRTLESFSARLRDEVALDTLAADLRGVVVETVQPAHVSLWMRPR